MGLIVTGMHRSGTSAVARVVKALGFDPGGELMEAAPDNPRGFFERRDVMNVNDRWLGSLGGSWWAPPLTTQATWRHLDNEVLDLDRKALGLFDPSSPAWFVKDPRISLLLPLWDRLAYEKVPSVIVVRDPREVASSLQLRNGMRSHRSVALWFAYVQAAIASSLERQVLIMDFDALIQSPSHSIEALSQFSRSNSQVDVDQPTVESLTRLIEPLLRRNHAGAHQGLPAGVIDEALDVYSHLTKGHAEQTVGLAEFTIPAWASDILDELRETYAQQVSAAQASETINELERSLQNFHSTPQIFSDMEIELRESRLRQEDAVAELERLTSELDQTRRDQLANESVIQQSTEVVTQLHSEAAQLQVQLNEVRIQADFHVAELQDLLEDSKETSESHARRVSDLQQDLLVKGADLNRLDSELIEAMNQLQQSQGRVTELASLNEELRQLATTEKEKSDQSLAALQVELGGVTETARMLHLRVSDLQKEAALKDSSLLAVRDDLQQAIADQDASKTAWVALESELSARIAVLNEVNHSLEQDLAQLKTALDQAQNQNSETQMQYQELSQVHESLKSSAAAERADWELWVTELSSELTESNRSRRKLKEHLVRFHNALIDSQLSIEEFKSRALLTQLQLEAKDEQLGMEAHLRQVQKIKFAGELRSQAARENQVILSLSEDLARASTNAYRIQGQLDEVTNELHQAQVSLSTTEQELAESNKESRNLRNFLVKATAESQSAQLAQYESQVAQIAESNRKWPLAKRLLRWAGVANNLGEPTPPILTNDPEAVAIVLESGLFDLRWYLEQNLDIAGSGIDPLMHFMVFGWREGRNPGPKFDLGLYQKTYLDAEAAPINPVVHYLLEGKQKGFSPRPKTQPFMDSEDTPDMILIRDSGLFDPSWYCQKYKDIAESGIDPLNHFANQGWREGRNPSSHFNTNRYREANLLFSQDSINPLVHYLRTELRLNSTTGQQVVSND